MGTLSTSSWYQALPLVAFCTGLVLAGCGAQSIPSLDALPPIPVGIDVAARSQLEAQHSKVKNSLTDNDVVAAGFDYGRLGQIYQAYGLLDPAILCYANASRLLPEDANWWHYRGLALRQQGDHQAAVESFRRGLEIRVSNELLQLRLAQSELALGNYEPARSAAKLIVGDESFAASGHLVLARVALAADEPALAVEELLRVIELQPQATQVHYTLALALREAGRPAEAEQHLDLRGPVAVSFPDPFSEQLAKIATAPGAHLRRGNQALLANRLEEAKDAFEAAVAGAPENPAGRRNLGLTLLRMGDGEGAIKHLEVAVRLSPENAGIRFDLGNALTAARRPEEAIRAFRKALQLAPGYSEARFNLANALITTGRWRAAERELASVVAERPGHTQARYQLAMMPVQLGDSEESERRLRSLLANDPRSVLARVGLAELLGVKGAFEEADQWLEEALEVAQEGEETAEVLRTRARWALAGGRPSVAIDSARRGLEARPEDAQMRRLLGEGLVLVGRWVEAREQLEPAASDPAAALALARLLAAAPHPRVRDGNRALQIAQQLVASQASIEHGEVYAMALAELGRTEEAAALAERLLEQAVEAGVGAEFRARVEESLAAYRAGRAFRLKSGRQVTNS